uniref:Uncharacterized protein n=1 Tax=Peronospora matthiolae TaxID=2874970 RepID=A0AAV1V1L7_9STRA
MKTGLFLYGALFAAAVTHAEDAPSKMAVKQSSVDDLYSDSSDLVEQVYTGSKKDPAPAPAPPTVIYVSPPVHTHAPTPAPTPSSTPAPSTPSTPWVMRSKEHNQVQPFAQVVGDNSYTAVAALKFKPQLHITSGCHSYPAVNAEGEFSRGLKPSGPNSGKCKGSGYGSQVYGRSAWCKDKWAIMYAWYFPKDNREGARHDWEHIVVWLDNPAVTHQKLLAVSIWDGRKSNYWTLPLPGPVFMDGSSPKLDYGRLNSYERTLSLTHLAGEFQPLIMWEQMTENARITFNTVLWPKDLMPMSNSSFKSHLEKASDYW